MHARRVCGSLAGFQKDMAFVTCYQGGVAIRTAPSVEAPCVGEVLQWNEVVSERPRNIISVVRGGARLRLMACLNTRPPTRCMQNGRCGCFADRRRRGGCLVWRGGTAIVRRFRGGLPRGGLPLVCCHRRSVAGTMPLSSSRMSYVYGISYGVRQQACQRARAASCALGHGSRVLVLNMTPDAYRRLQRLILPRFSHVHTVATP